MGRRAGPGDSTEEKMNRHTGIPVGEALLCGFGHSHAGRPATGGNEVEETAKGGAPDLQRGADQVEEALNESERLGSGAGRAKSVGTDV